MSTIDYESLGEKDKPNVYEDLEKKQNMRLKIRKKNNYSLLVLVFFLFF